MSKATSPYARVHEANVVPRQSMRRSTNMANMYTYIQETDPKTRVLIDIRRTHEAAR